MNQWQTEVEGKIAPSPSLPNLGGGKGLKDVNAKQTSNLLKNTEIIKERSEKQIRQTCLQIQKKLPLKLADINLSK